LNISFVLENPEDLALKTGCRDTHNIMTSAKTILQSYQ
jgi:hypothetical protein